MIARGRGMRIRVAAALAMALSSARAEDDVPLQAMRDELARSMSQLQIQQMDRPYFIAFRVDDVEGIAIAAVLGSLTAARQERSRLVGAELRVGDYALDSSNYFSTRTFSGQASSRTGPGPLDDSYQEIRRQLWLATDAQYKRALENLSAKRAALQARKRTEQVPDFSREAPHVEIGPVERTGARQAELEGLARELSAVFRSMPQIHRSSVKIDVRDVHTRYLNSEGSSFTRSSPSLRLQVDAEARSEDGPPVTDSLELHARRGSDLPPRERLLADIRRMAARILQLRSAPSLERYNGPVLFEGVAAAEIFAQQFASGLIAVRQPISDDPRFEMFYGQMANQLGGGSFLDKIGGRVLPEFLSVTDAPRQADAHGSPLLGGQAVDDDGVVTRETRLVERGILKTLLTTRVPVRTLLASTGSRRGSGPAPSNLVVSSERSVPGAELRRELLRRAKARGLDYGIIVRRVGGGGAGASLMRLSARMAAQSVEGSDAMAEVIRLYGDGREELLRGVELAELAPAAFREMVAVGEVPAVYSGEFLTGLMATAVLGLSSGAEVPVMSCAVPPLLFDEVSLARSQGPFPGPLVAASPLSAP